MGDFIGEGANNAWLPNLIQPSKLGYDISAPGPQDLVHTWAFLPDVATTVLGLLDGRIPCHRSGQKHRFMEFNFRGHRASIQDIANAI